MSITKAERLAKVHETALASFDRIQSALRDERLQCQQDRRFYSIAGAQWEGNLGAQFENKPKFEVNKIQLAVTRIVNDRVDVLFIPKDGTENDELTDSINGLFRADEQDSNAEEAYDNAFEEGTAGGFAGVRLRAVYEDEYDEDNDYQRIRIEPIFDADTSLYSDLNAKRQDKADATEAYLITAWSRSTYIETFGDDPTTWPKAVQTSMFDWFTQDVVYVAEYYKIEETSSKVITYEDLHGALSKYHESELNEELTTQLEATGHKVVNQRKVKQRRVHKYLMSGGKVLEDQGYIAGRCIPLAPYYGKRWYINNIERCMGHVRPATDAQRLKNMQLSRLGELAATSPNRIPIVTPEQIAGHEVMWQELNVKNYPYICLNPITDQNGNEVAGAPLGYLEPPTVPPAMAALLEITEQDMQDLLGNQQAAEELPNNTSGIAVELIQNKLDMQTFIYMSNFAKMKKRVGEIWLSMAQDVYVEDGRKMKTLDHHNKVSQVILGEPDVDEKTGRTIFLNNLQGAKLEATVVVGPSSESRRASVVRALTNMVQITDDPETKQVLSSMAIMNMEGEGINDIRMYFRKKLVTMGVLSPTDDEQAQMKQAANQPDPQSQYLAAAAKQAEAEAVSANADTILKLAKADQAKADTAKTISEISQADRDHSLRAVETLHKVISSQQPTNEGAE
jgi:uncharacterized protein YdaT